MSDFVRELLHVAPSVLTTLIDVIQLAKSSGYEVIATASPKNFDLLKSYGASAVYACQWCHPIRVKVLFKLENTLQMQTPRPRPRSRPHTRLSHSRWTAFLRTERPHSSLAVLVPTQWARRKLSSC